MRITILNSRKYDFVDPKTQKQISGIKVQYLFNDTLQPVVVDNNMKGYYVADGTLTLDKEGMLKDVPGVYEANFATIVNAKNQPIQKLVAINYISTVPEAISSLAVQKKVL